MPVTYDSKKLIPAPLVNIEQQYQQNSLGVIGQTFILTVEGTLVAFKGSPDSSGNFWSTSGYPADENISSSSRLASILKKQQALISLFQNPGRWFEIQSADGSAPMKCNPRTTSVTFPQGVWFDRCDYTVVLEADVLYLGPTAISGEFIHKISDASEQWTVELAEDTESIDLPFSYRLTHTVSAVGKRYFSDDQILEKEPWLQAKSWVMDRLSTVPSEILASSGALNIPSFYGLRNQVRSESIDKAAGSYSISDAWIVTSGTTLESCNISINRNLSDGLTQVGLEGTIRGLEIRDNNYQITTTKYTNADAKFTAIEGSLFSRAQTYSNINLNTLPITQVIGRNPTDGVITYNYEYNNRPSNCIAGARLEQITITDYNQLDVFASVPVLGRIAGPVLQNIRTKTAPRRELVVECMMEPTGINCTNMFSDIGKPNISSVIVSATGSLSFSQIFKDNDTESWNPKTGSFSRNIGWTYL